MVYDKKCCNAKCNCRKFYMRFTGYHIELRCENGHYVKNVGRKTDYPILRQYENVVDATGFDVDITDNNSNVINLNQHNLKDTISGDLLLQKDAREKVEQYEYKNKSTNYKKEYKKTGTTDNPDAHLFDNIAIY